METHLLTENPKGDIPSDGNSPWKGGRKPLRNPTRNLPRAVKFGLLRQVRKERWKAVMSEGTTCRGWHRPIWESSATRRREKEAAAS